MAASFPNALKTFSAVVNGVTKLVAALFNSPYDEISAVETFIGPTGGGAQAYSESITNMLLNYRRGCSVDYKSASDLYVRAGEVMIYDASGNRRLRRNTSDTTVTWANIDTGAEASSTVYYVYAVADTAATTFTVLISTNATTPTGATFYRLLGSFYNDGSSNIDASRFSGVANSLVQNSQNGSVVDVYAYGTSLSAYTIKTNKQLKIAFGTATQTSGTISVSNLPFSDTNYVIFGTREHTVGGYQSQTLAITAKSASSFDLYDNLGGTKVVNWFAIGY